MAFGEKLQEVRKQSGMTQETFAEQLHVSRQAVSRWESGRGYPEIEKILYICHRYHTTLDALFADELPPVEAEEAEVEQPIAGKPLKRSFVDFLSNLSPYDKLIGGTLIFIVLLSLMALAHSMKGGSGSNMTSYGSPPSSFSALPRRRRQGWSPSGSWRARWPRCSRWSSARCSGCRSSSFWRSPSRR